MKNFEKNLKQVKPQASKGFRKGLEASLMERADEMERYQKHGFFNFKILRGLSFASVVGLVILAIFVSTVSPAALSEEEFIARASEYYSEDNGVYRIFHGKALIDNGTGIFGISTAESWVDTLGNDYSIYGGYHSQCIAMEECYLPPKWEEAHHLWIVDESGASFTYSDMVQDYENVITPPVVERSYCISKNATDKYIEIQSYYVPGAEDFDENGVLASGGEGAWASGYMWYLSLETGEPVGDILDEEGPADAFFEAYGKASGYRKGAILFDYYAKHQDELNFETREENGENVYVFTKGSGFSGKFEDIDKLEIVFNQDYQLIQDKIFYKGDRVVTSKFEHEIVDIKKEEIFDPDLYDLVLVNTEASSVSENTEPGCYFFDGKRMNPKEAKEAWNKIPQDVMPGVDKNAFLEALSW